MTDQSRKDTQCTTTPFASDRSPIHLSVGLDEQTLRVDQLEIDERAAMRAFLQRCEVRLSTVHRVATALLSGAGLMVLLPAIARDSIVSVIRTLVSGELDLAHICLLAAMVALLALPFAALWLVLRDLTLFYFHAQHVAHDGHDVFTPRFTLTGIRLPSDELGLAARNDLTTVRTSAANIDLLVPSNDLARSRIDRQLDAYGGLGRHDVDGDLGRAGGLFELTASRDRSLIEEVAKVEYGIARHILRVQVIVLRYVKALLAFLTTALAVFAAAAVLEDTTTIGPTEELWLVCITAIWAPSLVAVVTAPVRWLDQLLRAEGASRSAVADDPELTKVERLAIWAAGAAWLLVAVAAVAVATDAGADDGGIVASLTVVSAAGALLWWQVLNRWRATRR